MTKDEIIAIAVELVGARKPFVLGTVDAAGQPQMRWMGDLLREEPLVIWMAGGAQSRKVVQLQAHPQAQLILQAPDFSTVVTLSGRCETCTDAASKQKVWDGIPGLARHSSGPDDPKMAALRFVTERVEVLQMAAGTEPLVAEL